MVSDNGLFNFKASDFSNPGSGTPDNILDLQIGEGVALDVNNLDQQGHFIVPDYIDGEDAFNAFVDPLIQQYGYLDNGVRTGGGDVGVDDTFDANDFYSQSFQIGYDHYIGKHELHIGYR